MFKIGQFANLCQVSVKTLRYYESIGILIPAKTDKFTGYRYYLASQMQQLNKIIAFKDMGFSLSEIGDLLSDTTSLEITAMLKLKEASLKADIRNANSKLKRIEDLIEQFNKERNIMYDVSIKKIKGFMVASYREVRKSPGDQGEMWEKLTSYIRKHGAKILPGCFVSYHNFGGEATDIEVFEPIDKKIPATSEINVKNMPEVTVASVIHKGPYVGLRDAFAYLGQWLEDNHYEMVDLGREIYVSGAWNCDDEKDYISEVQIPVIKKK